MASKKPAVVEFYVQQNLKGHLYRQLAFLKKGDENKQTFFIFDLKI